MPEGMYLRTTSDVQLDPLGVDTIEKFLEILGLTPTGVGVGTSAKLIGRAVTGRQSTHT
jgi:hypothetical protein